MGDTVYLSPISESQLSPRIGNFRGSSHPVGQPMKQQRGRLNPACRVCPRTPRDQLNQSSSWPGFIMRTGPEFTNRSILMRSRRSTGQVKRAWVSVRIAQSCRSTEKERDLCVQRANDDCFCLGASFDAPQDPADSPLRQRLHIPRAPEVTQPVFQHAARLSRVNNGKLRVHVPYRGCPLPLIQKGSG